MGVAAKVRLHSVQYDSTASNRTPPRPTRRSGRIAQRAHRPCLHAWSALWQTWQSGKRGKHGWYAHAHNGETIQESRVTTYLCHTKHVGGKSGQCSPLHLQTALLRLAGCGRLIPHVRHAAATCPGRQASPPHVFPVQTSMHLLTIKHINTYRNDMHIQRAQPFHGCICSGWSRRQSGKGFTSSPQRRDPWGQAEGA